MSAAAQLDRHLELPTAITIPTGPALVQEPIGESKEEPGGSPWDILLPPGSIADEERLADLLPDGR